MLFPFISLSSQAATVWEYKRLWGRQIWTLSLLCSMTLGKGKINFSNLHFFIQFLSGSNKGYITTSTLGDLIEEMNEYQLHYRIPKPLVFTVCQLQCLPNGCEISVFWCSWYHIMHVSILRVSMRHTSFRFCLCQHKKIWNKIDSTSLCLCGFPFSIAFFKKGVIGYLEDGSLWEAT